MTSTPIGAVAVRRAILEQSHRANVGHIGSALSIVELLIALYGGVLRRRGPGAHDRDRFILSKGHAALALYAVLHEAGELTADDLATYCQDGTLLGVHPDRAVRGIDFSTGSLGHGLSIGAGAALAARLDGSARRVYVLASDAELNEGSVWEAALFAAQHRLGSLAVIVDANGQQALGRTAEVLPFEPAADRWRSFGWDAVEVDGHDIDAISAVLAAPGERPLAVIARTVFGRGVSFMEGQLKWHYWPLSPAEYEQALAEVGPA